VAEVWREEGGQGRCSPAVLGGAARAGRHRGGACKCSWVLKRRQGEGEHRDGGILPRGDAVEDRRAWRRLPQANRR